MACDDLWEVSLVSSTLMRAILVNVQVSWCILYLTDIPLSY
jgi:hypothetical protein